VILEVVAKDRFKLLPGRRQKKRKIRIIGSDVAALKQLFLRQQNLQSAPQNSWLPLSDATSTPQSPTPSVVSPQQAASPSPSRSVTTSQAAISATKSSPNGSTLTIKPTDKIATGGQTINVSSPQIAMPPSVSYTDLKVALVAPPPLEEDEQQP
jgi:hypothetical protein